MQGWTRTQSRPAAIFPDLLFCQRRVHPVLPLQPVASVCLCLMIYLLCVRSLASASSPWVLVLPYRSSAVQGRVSSSCLWCKFDSSLILMFLPTILPSLPAANRRQRNCFSPLVIQRRTHQSRLPRMFLSFLAAASGRETYLISRIANEPLDVPVDVCPPLFLERLLLCRASPRLNVPIFSGSWQSCRNSRRQVNKEMEFSQRGAIIWMLVVIKSSFAAPLPQRINFILWLDTLMAYYHKCNVVFYYLDSTEIALTSSIITGLQQL